MANVLIIDDDKGMCKMLSDMVERLEHDATSTHTLKDGLERALSGTFDVVFLDVLLPDGNGLEVLPKIRETGSSPEVVIITGAADPDGAEIAIKNGAWDYLQKPLSPKKIILPISRVLQYRDDLKKVKKPLVALKREGIVGDSPQMQACLDSLAQAAGSEANVLILGETGTGKELFANAIHFNSPRANKNFVVVDCAALPEMLVESIIFGHKKGAFTGADKDQEGLVKQADEGTLFLDEIGELPLSAQGAFLRVLQEHRFRPVGGKQEIKSDFRLVAATNKDPDKMVESGRFRDDLLFRLQAFTITLLPLREHPEDIPDLILYHIAKICRRYEIGTKGYSPEFLDALMAYHWPGNVRELVNTLETALTSARYDHNLFPKHLPIKLRIKVARDSVSKEFPAKVSPEVREDASRTLPSFKDFRTALAAEAEKQYLQDLLSLTRNNIKEACRISGLSRSRLYEILKKHKIPTLALVRPFPYPDSP